MTDLTKFKQYYAVSSRLLDLASREEMAEVMRLLALHVAHLERLYGQAPPSNLFELLGAQELSDDQAELLSDAMQVLTGYLAVFHEMDETPGH